MAYTSFGSVLEDDVQYEDVGATKTLDIGDVGVEQRCPVNTTITLPSTVVGYYYRIVCTAPGVTVNVNPAALDQLEGNGFTGAANKDAILTAGNVGDCIEILGDGSTGWYFTKVVGTWAREA